jgi:hypothetical protein
MTTEDDTFRALVKLPFDEVYQKVEEAFKDSNQGISPVYKLGAVVVERRTYYNPMIVRHYTLMKVLEESHRTFDEFALACEKKAIIEQVKEYNDNLEFPQEIIDRARQFFPDLKFTPAKLDLE